MQQDNQQIQSNYKSAINDQKVAPNCSEGELNTRFFAALPTKWEISKTLDILLYSPELSPLKNVSCKEYCTVIGKSYLQKLCALFTMVGIIGFGTGVAALGINLYEPSIANFAIGSAFLSIGLGTSLFCWRKACKIYDNLNEVS